jgi:hypothetical protein
MNLLFMQFSPVPHYLFRLKPLSGAGLRYFHASKFSCYGAQLSAWFCLTLRSVKHTEDF